MPLNTIVTDFVESHGYSLSSNGYQKLPSGLIIQWGSVAFPAGTGQAAGFAGTFSIAFPNSVFSLTASARHSPGIGLLYVDFPSFSTTGFTANLAERGSGNAYSAGAILYIAIGY